ncbi:MAG: gamma carbonic anhydrase family protein [Alphaproteobacteria bacterium]|nr:gamma carbonic anhydrase family protein [Alphaproteobacteria bacterium]
MQGLILPYRGLAPRVAADAFIAPMAVVVGDVEIEAEVSVWYGAVVRGDVNRVHIGRASNIQDNAVIHVGSDTPTWIGAYVLVGHLAMLHGCRLEDGAFVGMKATVLDGAVVEGGAMVAAGAVVTPGKRVKHGELWAGNPAKFMRALTPGDIARIPKAVALYADMARHHMATLGRKAAE